MAVFTREQVDAIAALAHLALDDAEIDLFARQLGDILDYATAGAAGRHDRRAAHGERRGRAHAGRSRRRASRPSLDRDDALAQAPDATLDAGFFKVPRVIG